MLLLAVACDAAATATPAPTPTATSTPVLAATAAPAPAPTPIAAPTPTLQQQREKAVLFLRQLIQISNNNEDVLDATDLEGALNSGDLAKIRAAFSAGLEPTDRSQRQVSALVPAPEAPELAELKSATLRSLQKARQGFQELQSMGSPAEVLQALDRLGSDPDFERPDELIKGLLARFNISDSEVNYRRKPQASAPPAPAPAPPPPQASAPWKLTYLNTNKGRETWLENGHLFEIEGTFQVLLLNDSPDSNVARLRFGQDLESSMQYFLTRLEKPREAFWVNLNPREPDRIIGDALKATDAGRIMLEADLQMKKDFSNFSNPCTSKVGEQYWQALMKKREELVATIMREHPGQIQDPGNVFLFSAVIYWIVSNGVTLYDNNTEAFIANAELTIKGTAETELSTYIIKNQRADGLSAAVKEKLGQAAKDIAIYDLEISNDLLRPLVTREINEGPGYGALRAVHQAFALADWFKSTGKTPPWPLPPGEAAEFTSNLREPRTVWNEYVKSFNEGEYLCVKKETIGRVEWASTYTKGGVDFSVLILNKQGDVPESMKPKPEDRTDALKKEGHYWARCTTCPQLTAAQFELGENTVSSEYYKLRKDNEGKTSRHGGIDFRSRPDGADEAPPVNRPFIAGVAGTLEVGGGGFNTIKVRTEDNYEVRYLHAKTTTGKSGEAVTQNQQIGVTGDTGSPNELHLHVQVHYKGRVVDPNWFFCVHAPKQYNTSPRCSGR